MHKLMSLEFRVVQKPFTTALYRTDKMSLSMSEEMLPQSSNVSKKFLAARMMVTSIQII